MYNIHICIVWQALCILYGKLFKLINVSPHHLVCCHVNHKSWRLYQNTHATLRSNQNVAFSWTFVSFGFLLWFSPFVSQYLSAAVYLSLCQKKHSYLANCDARIRKAVQAQSSMTKKPSVIPPCLQLFGWRAFCCIMLRRPFLMLPCASKKAFCCSVLRRPVVMLLLWYLWTVFIEFQFEMAIVSYSIT